MLAGPAGSADVEADAEMVGLHLSRVEQAAKQRVLRPLDRMQRPGAVERIGKARALGLGSAAATKLDLEPPAGISRREDAARDDLEPILGNHPRHRRRNFGSNTVAVYVP